MKSLMSVINTLTLLSAVHEVRDQTDQWARFAVIEYDIKSGQFVFSARRWSNTVTSYVCQQQQQGLVNPLYYIVFMLWQIH